jgi:sugar lactone lactonase YvrE
LLTVNRFRVLTLLGAALLVATSVAVSATGTASIATVAGNGSQGFAGDGGPAAAAQLATPAGVALTADGGYLIADSGNARVRKVSAAGVITTVAGSGVSGLAGDGGPATAAQLYSANAVAVLPDGSFLIADAGNKRIRQVTAAGVMITAAGGGPLQLDIGDGGPATAALLNNPADVAVTPDGGFLIADTANWRIRKVAASGVITTVAGNGQHGFSGDGGPATAAQLAGPAGVAPTADGGFLIADSENNRIRKVSAAGMIATVAGVGTGGFSGDGGPATAAQLNHPIGVTPTADGGFYIADTFNHRIRFVSAAGTIATVAGGGSSGAGDGGLPTAAGLSYPSSVALTADGYLIAEQTGNRIRRVSAVAAKLAVRLTGPARCVKAAFNSGVRVTSTNPVKSVSVFLDGHRVATKKSTHFSVRIKAKPLKRGRHVLRAEAVDSTGKHASAKRNFTRCKA